MSLKTNFTEKYRPQDFNEVLGQDSHVEKFMKMVSEEMLPHLLFYGPAGTGKTTCAKILVKAFDAEVMTINASDERGIDIIRGKVKSFMSTLSMTGKTKVLFAEEADQMTRDAQLVLRAMMEDYEHNCRIIFLCNYVEKIDDKIQSRCSMYEFRPIRRDATIKYIKRISGRENIDITPQAVALLAEICKGDLRRVCRSLQDLALPGKRIGVGDIRESTEASFDAIAKVCYLIRSKDVFESISACHEHLKVSGVQPRRFIQMIHEYLIETGDFLPTWMVYLSETDVRLARGGTDLVQIDGLICMKKRKL